MSKRKNAPTGGMRTSNETNASKFSVFATGISPDLKSASPEFDLQHLGVYSLADMLVLLRELQGLFCDASEASGEPKLLIQGPSKTHHIWFSAERLIYADDGPDAKKEPIQPEGICERISESVVDVVVVKESSREEQSARFPWQQAVVAVIIASVVIHVGLYAFGYYRLTKPVKVEPLEQTYRLNELKKLYTGVFWASEGKSRTVLAVSPQGEAHLYQAGDNSLTDEIELIDTFDCFFARVLDVDALVLSSGEIIDLAPERVLVFRGIPLVPVELGAEISIALQAGVKKSGE